MAVVKYTSREVKLVHKIGPGSGSVAVLALAMMSLHTGLAERPSAFTNQSKPHTVKVTFLAVSSSSRQSFAGNREIYLADLQRKDGDHEFVRIIDQYPGYGLPIRDSLLKNQTLFRMAATREPECDLPGNQVFLATSNKVVFNDSVRQTLLDHQTNLIPCYKTLHQTIQVSKAK